MIKSEEICKLPLCLILLHASSLAALSALEVFAKMIPLHHEEDGRKLRGENIRLFSDV